MFKPKTNEEILAQQTKDLERAQRQKRKYDRQTERNREKKNKYDSNTGHGIALMLDEKPNTEWQRAVDNERKRRGEQLESAEASRDKAKEDAKKSKEEMKDSKRKMAGRKLMDGKGMGLVVFNEKGNPVVQDGKVKLKDPRDGKMKEFSVVNGRIPNDEVRRNEEQVRSGRSMSTDQKTSSKVVYPSNPTPDEYARYMANSSRSDIQGVDASWYAAPTPKKEKKPSKNDGKNNGNGKGQGGKTDKAEPEPKKNADLHKQIMDRAGIPEEMRGHFIVASMSGKPSHLDYNKISRWGHPIRQLYRGSDGTIYAVAFSDSEGLIWGTEYNPATGFWKKSIRHLNQSQINSRAKGMSLMLDNTTGNSVMNSCKRKG